MEKWTFFTKTRFLFKQKIFCPHFNKRALNSFFSFFVLGNVLQFPWIQISWNLMIFVKLYLRLIFWDFFVVVFFKIWTGFFHCSTFSRPGVIFIFLLSFCILSVGIMNICLTILVVFESREFRKSYIHFSNNFFPIGTVFINLGNHIWGK